MRAEDIHVNSYVSLTEIAREKKSSSPSYLIQRWLRSTTTIEYLRMCVISKSPISSKQFARQTPPCRHPSGSIQQTYWGSSRAEAEKAGLQRIRRLRRSFRAWLFPEYILKLVRWYWMYQHTENESKETPAILCLSGGII